MSKNIILCADGTGNARGRTHGTNVGRLFKAVDPNKGKQVAVYDDGVGTHRVKALKLIGGVFGWGLKANVIDLYEALCRRYEPGDRIYIFGFSRGAYTARLLAGLVCTCGVIKVQRSADGDGVAKGKPLETAAEEAYGSYRKNRRWNGETSSSPAERFRKTYSVDKDAAHDAHDQRIHVRFVGVWDTVGAVGLPIDEMAESLDAVANFIFSDKVLSPLVDKGCHAIAIDDQRHTFHPEMWQQDDTIAADGRERTEQVWFAGMHSNVGGGYPKDELAYVPLVWMMKRAAANGMTFDETVFEDYRRQANPIGRMYNSRAGLAMGYRYNPRNMEDIRRAAGIDTIKIHASVADRLFSGFAAYGPANFPSRFTFVTDDDVNPDTYPNERRILEDKRDTFKNAFRDVSALVWWRRVLYGVVLSTILAVVSVPVWSQADASLGVCNGTTCYFEWALGLLSTVTAGAADPLAAHLLANPLVLNGAVSVLITALILQLLLKRMTHQSGLDVWGHLTGTGRKIGPKRWYHALGHAIRTHGMSKAMARAFKAVVLRWGTWLAVLMVVPGLPLLGLINWSQNDGAACVAADHADVGASTQNPCFDTGVSVVAGRTYTLTADDRYRWIDKTIDAPVPGGFRSDQGSALMHLASPFRRHQDQRWFQLMARIGDDDATAAAVGSNPFTFTAPASGSLQVFVNDVVCEICSDRWTFYGNNVGRLCGTISETGTDDAQTFGACPAAPGGG